MRRCLVLAASATRFCPVCHGSGRVTVQALPEGAPVESRCTHCGPDHTPIVHLPAYTDRRSA